MRIVILGCGRVGARLAIGLDREGHSVTVIDRSNDNLQRFLSAEYQGAVVLGNGIDEDVLRRAGIEQADVFAAVTDDDDTNIMASQVAQAFFRVPKVICRIYDPIRNETYRTLGLQTVAPVLLAANRIRDLLRAGPRRASPASADRRERG